MLALSAAFLVSLKQLVPEHTVSLFNSLLRIRIKHFPALFVLANMLSGPLLGTDTATWLALFGFLTGWLYLRFYRISDIGATTATTGSATGGQGAQMQGDASETFSFVSFFPEVFHPVLAPVCDSVYEALVQMKLCTPFSDSAIETATENAASRSEGGLPSIMTQGGGGGGGGGKRAEAERRRALALKALDQRLNAAAVTRDANATAAGSSGGPETAAAGVEGNAAKSKATEGV